MEIEIEICDRCGECFSWHGEANGIRKVKIKKHGYECSPDRSFVLCPSAYEKMYISAFEQMLDVRKAKGLPCDWQSGIDVFRWWMEDDNISGQLSMDDLMEDNNV